MPKVKVEGKLFTGNVNAAVNRAVDKLRPQAINIVRSNTPVRTGLLKSNWFTEVGRSSNSVTMALHNDTRYASFVEYGTRFMKPRAMARRSMPAIRERFTQILQDELNQELGSDISNISAGISNSLTRFLNSYDG